MNDNLSTARSPVKPASESVRRARDMLESTELRQTMAGIFKLLADPTRLKIVSALLEYELCVGDISALTELSQSSVSHHLKTLREANLVTCKRQGKKAYYSLADSHVTALLAVARDHARESL
jgi:ArsR family transcriptional regulator, lead/cadmium/zinc/bismuth-responsive transcriptional repressor